MRSQEMLRHIGMLIILISIFSCHKMDSMDHMLQLESKQIYKIFDLLRNKDNTVIYFPALLSNVTKS